MLRFIGLCSTLGGAAWVAACLVHNSLPQGCVGEGCALGLARGHTTVDAALIGLAGALLAASSLGMFLLARGRGEAGRTGTLAVGAGLLSLLLLVAAGVMASVNDTWEGMPALVVPGVVLLAVALICLGVVVLRARILPTWAAVSLIVTALLLPLSNEQTSRVLLAVPFGLAWVAAGILVLRQSNNAAALSQ